MYMIIFVIAIIILYYGFGISGKDTSPKWEDLK